MRNKWGLAVLLAGSAVITGSALWLALTGNAEVRYSADHGDTVPMWFRWVPALVGIALVRLAPLRGLPGMASTSRAPYLEATVLLTTAVAFAVSLRLAGGGEPAHTLLKLLLLLAVPAAVFWMRRGTAWKPDLGGFHAAPWWPLIPVTAWAALSYTGPFAMPPSDYAMDPLTLTVTLVVVFLANAVLEEVFYRRWLQTRWERILGTWPAIVLTSLLWAAWHIGIQGGGSVPQDLATVFVNQGVQGLFLGYLWSRYRSMWPTLVVHGLTNSAPVLLGLL